MTKEEELNYLLDIIMSATTWRVSEDDPRSPLEIEIRQRLDIAMGKEPVEVDGRTQSIECPTETADEPRVKKPDSHGGKVKVKLEDGKYHWIPIRECKQVPCSRSRTGYMWVRLTDEDFKQQEAT